MGVKTYRKTMFSKIICKQKRYQYPSQMLVMLVLTDVESTNEPLKEDSSNKVILAVKDEPENTPPKFIPINEVTDTPRQKSMLATPKSVAAESCVTSFCVTFLSFCGGP